MKEEKIIRDPEAFQLLADETRLKMIYLLRAKEMTVSQIAHDLGLTPQTIYHHIKKLREVEMVEVAREERVDHLVESYYRATAGVFHFVDGACKRETDAGAQSRKTLEAMARLGHEVDFDDSVISKIVSLTKVIRGRREDPRMMERVFEIDNLDPFTQMDVIELTLMIEADDADFAKYLDAQRELRDLLRARRSKSGP